MCDFFLLRLLRLFVSYLVAACIVIGHLKHQLGLLVGFVLLLIVRDSKWTIHMNTFNRTNWCHLSLWFWHSHWIHSQMMANEHFSHFAWYGAPKCSNFWLTSPTPQPNTDQKTIFFLSFNSFPLKLKEDFRVPGLIYSVIKTINICMTWRDIQNEEHTQYPVKRH